MKSICITVIGSFALLASSCSWKIEDDSPLKASDDPISQIQGLSSSSDPGLSSGDSQSCSGQSLSSSFQAISSSQPLSSSSTPLLSSGATSSSGGILCQTDTLIIADTAITWREGYADGHVDTLWTATRKLHAYGGYWKVNQSENSYKVYWYDAIYFVEEPLDPEACPDTIRIVRTTDTVYINWGPDSLISYQLYRTEWTLADSLKQVFSALDSGFCGLMDLPGTSGYNTRLIGTPPTDVELRSAGDCSQVTLQCPDTVINRWEPCIDWDFTDQETHPSPTYPMSMMKFLILPHGSMTKAGSPWGITITNPYGFSDTLWIQK